MFAAVLDQAAEQVSAAMRERAVANRWVGAWLAELLAPEHLHRLHAPGTHGVLFADTMAHTTQPQVKEAIRRAHRTVARTLADQLARGQADGSVRPDLDPRTAAWWLLSFLASQGFRSAAMPDRSTPGSPAWHHDPAGAHHRPTPPGTC